MTLAARGGGPGGRRAGSRRTGPWLDPYAAAVGGVVHLLAGWADGMPAALLTAPGQPPLYLYRDGRTERLDA